MSKKITALIIFLVIAMPLVGCGEKKQYEEAQNLASQKQYEEAITILTEINDYENSADLIRTYQLYLDAKTAFEKGDILEYLKIIDENGLDIDENYKEDILNEAVEEASEGNLEVAISLISNIEDYKNSAELLELYRENIVYCGVWETLACRMYYKNEYEYTSGDDTVDLKIKISGIDEITYIANGHTVKMENGVLTWTDDGNEWRFYIDKALVERFLNADFFYASDLQSPKKYASYAYEDEVTSSQANALTLAEQYLETTSFSYNGLIEQLKYDGVFDADAKYAADMCGADWNEEAKKTATVYKESGMTSGLTDQLIYEGFTYQQAHYAIDILRQN